MANAFFFILLCIGCWRSFVIAVKPCIPEVKGEPFVQYVENKNCEVDEKLLKLFNPVSFNESVVNKDVINFMCTGFIDTLNVAKNSALEYLCVLGLLSDIRDTDFCSDSNMMTVLEKVVNGSVLDRISMIVANFTRHHCHPICDSSNELCWAFGITAKLVLKQSVMITTPPTTTTTTTDPTTVSTTEPSVTTKPSFMLPTFDETTTATSDGNDDDHKDEDHDHNDDENDHNDGELDHNDDDHDHNNDDHDLKDEDHDHNDEDHDHNDEDHDHNDEDHDHNDGEHEHVNDGHDGATDKPVKVANNTSSKDDKGKIMTYFDKHSTQDVSNTVGQDVGEGNKKHDDGVTGTDITDNQEAATSISDEGTQDVHDNAINQITNTNDIATEKNITSDEGNTSTSVELDPNDDDLFEDDNFDGDQNGKQNDDDHSDQGGDQDNSDHDGINRNNVIEVDDDDDDDGYSYWHFATILLFILFLGVAGYLASHNRKKIRESVSTYMSKRKRKREYKPVNTMEAGLS